MVQCVMSAMEEQKVVTCDIQGEFLQSDWPDDNDCFIFNLRVLWSKCCVRYIPATKVTYCTLWIDKESFSMANWRRQCMGPF